MSLNLSIFDIKRHEKMKNVDESNKEVLNEVLFEMGMDINKGFKVLNCIHRSVLTDKVHQGKLYEGTERTDEDWLVTKYMINSLERFGHVEGYMLDGHSQSFMTALKAKQIEYYGGVNA